MLVKGIVISMAEDIHQVYITIPLLDNTTSKTDFRNVSKRLATICTIPGCKPLYARGDVVYVDFEQDDQKYPVVLGMLYRAEPSDSISDMKAQSLEVEVNTKLSNDVSIGDLNYNSLLNSSRSISIEDTDASDISSYNGTVITDIYKGEVSES